MKPTQPHNLERLVSSAVAALVAMALTGCPGTPPAAEEQAGHDHTAGHEHPTTLAEAHEQLEHMSAEIQAAFDDGNPDDAHEAMHEIGHVIQEIPELAKKAGVEAADDVQQATDDLMDSFMKLDGVMHGGEKVAWSDVSDKVDAALAKIEGWLPEGAHEDHDHEEGEHAPE